MNTGVKVVLVILCVVGLIFLVFGGMVVSAGNDMVGKRNEVNRAWANVEAAYQNRFDTITKFAETAKFSSQFQINLTIKYAEARSKVNQAIQEGKSPDEIDATAKESSDSLRIMIQQEAVPEAKTDQLTELNSQIDSVERVIRHERGVFNTAVMNYNNAIQMWPGSAFISMFGWNYEPRTGFKSQSGTETSPPINLIP